MATATLEIAHPIIKIGGSEITVDLLTLDVENMLFGPSEACLVYSSQPDPASGELRDIDKFNLGDAIEVGAKVADATTTLFKGEIVGIEFEYDDVAQGSTVRVRALDKFHRLWRGTKLRTFKEQKVSDVASKILTEAGIDKQVTATTTQHKWLIQNNVSDGEYLLDLAAQDGLVVWCAEGKVTVEPRTASFPDGPTLAYGEHLTRIRTSHNAAAAVSKVTVHGWDRQQKQAVTGTASSFKMLGHQAVEPSNLSSKFGQREAVAADSWVPDQSSADKAAQALLDQLGDAMVRVEGEAFFSADIKVATLLAIDGLGTRFNGKHFVTAVHHRFSSLGTTTEFICAGPTAEGFVPLAAGGTGAQASPGRRASEVLGPMIAIVTNVDDPEKMGRVKVKLPQLGKADGTEIESEWMRYVAPMAGNAVGMMFVPDVNDEVLVVFEHGLVEHGYVIGGVWGGKDKPPLDPAKYVDGGKVMRRYMKTTGGMIVDFNETGTDKPGITFQDKDGNVVKILTQDKKIELDCQGNKVTIDGGAKKITLDSQGDVEIKAQQKVTITGQTGVSIESSGGNFEAKGLQATMQGQTKASVTGATAALEGQAQATVKAAMVMIN